jgi:ATP/maltotriose-dependent transcriptional regulator MalT
VVAVPQRQGRRIGRHGAVFEGHQPDPADLLAGGLTRRGIALPVVQRPAAIGGLHVAEGLSNHEVGERLGLAEKTIKHYMTNILGKLQVRSRVEAALLVAREGSPQKG